MRFIRTTEYNIVYSFDVYTSRECTIRCNDNTIIIFTSDHGLAVGQHGLIGKQSLYDHSIRVPMIISGPKIKKGIRFNEDVYLQDIVPTTLDLAQISVPKEVDFKSFYKLIVDGENKKIHDGIYGTFGCCQSNYVDFQRMIRKDGYKLMLFPKNKRVELYNLNDDPFETNNIFTGKSETEKELKEKLEQWFNRE